MRRAATLLACLALACAKSDKQDPAPTSASSGVPRLFIKDQPSPPPFGNPSAPPADAGAERGGRKTDGRATEAGKLLHDQAAQGCKDPTCLGDKCGRLCAQFIRETYQDGEITTARQKNGIYFDCLGACLHEPDR
jgi:hypothetical protein